jgi:hypothetical protein
VDYIPILFALCRLSAQVQAAVVIHHHTPLADCFKLIVSVAAYWYYVNKL